MPDLSRIATADPIIITDGSSLQAALGTTAPAGTEVAQLVRNIPSGTQAVSGTITLSSQTVTLSSQTITIGSSTATVPVSGTITNVPSGTQTVANSPVTTATGTLTSATATNAALATLTLASGQGTAVVSIHGTYTIAATPTIQFQASDDGSTWYAIEGVVTDNSASVGTVTLTNSLQQAYFLSGHGGAWKNLRVLYATGSLSSGTATVNMTVASGSAVKSVLCQGDIASGIANSGSPIQVGGRAVTAAGGPAVVADAQRVAAIFDKQGRQIIANYAGRDNVISTVVAFTTTVAANIIGAQGAGIFFDITSLILTNGTAGTEVVTISDGTLSYKFACVANSTIVVPLPVPLKATTANTAWTASCGTGASTVWVNVVGVKTL